MSKVDDYKKKKMIEELMLPKLWVVHSDRDGVSMPRELQVISIIHEAGIRYYDNNVKVRLKKYKFDESPYELDIEDGQTRGTSIGYGTGEGDIWSWTWFFSLTAEDALDFYKEECKRVTEKYKSTDMNRKEEIKKQIQELELELQKIENSENVDIKSKLYNQFISRYSGTHLLKEHSLDEEGIWEVRGEDPNCDLGGSHHEPYLCTLEGKLYDVIHEAVLMHGFWQWGSGGSIKKIVPIKIKKN